MSDVLDQLTSGSVWMRKDGSLNTVLFISNLTLSDKALKSFPQQVVYTDGDANVFTRGIDDFIANRQFYNVNGELESRLDNLFQLDASALAEDDLMLDDDDELQVSDAGSVAASLTADTPEWQDEALAGLDTVDYKPPVTYLTTGNSPFDLTMLSKLTASYVQEPVIADNMVYHKLYIQATPSLNKDLLHALFTVTGDVQLTPVVDAPAYSSEPITVDWDSFLGVYVQVYEDVTYFIVMLGTRLMTETISDVFDSVKVFDNADGSTSGEVTSQPQPQPQPQPQLQQVQAEVVVDIAQTAAAVQ